MRADAFGFGLWQFRAGTGNFAWAGIDMALADICGKAVGQPLWRLLGGALRNDVTYFFYLSRGDDDELRAQVASGLAAGYDVFYLKVGLDEREDLRMVATLRDALGAGPKLRHRRQLQLVRAAGPAHARAARGVRHRLRRAARARDAARPARRAARGARRSRSAANEGLWSEADAYARIRAREADVYCFSLLVGRLAGGVLAARATSPSSRACRSASTPTASSGITAAACQHVLLTLPNVVDGHQQTAQMMVHDVLTRGAADRARARTGASSTAPGLGVEVDADAVAEAAGRYRSEGQYLPWQPYLLGREERRVSGRLEGKVGARRRRRLGHGPGRRRRDGERGRARRGRRHRPRARRGRGRELRRHARWRSTCATPRASSAWSRRRSSASGASTPSITAPSTCRS